MQLISAAPRDGCDEFLNKNSPMQMHGAVFVDGYFHVFHADPAVYDIIFQIG